MARTTEMGTRPLARTAASPATRTGTRAAVLAVVLVAVLASGCDGGIFGTGDGSDILLDFEAGVDRVEFALDGVGSVRDLRDAVELVALGDSIALDFGDGDVLTLRGVSLSDLSASDAIFA